MALPDKKSGFLFISDNPELNSALSRYFRYVHHEYMTMTTSDFGSCSLPAESHDTIIIWNEVLIDGEIFGIYPFWFYWGKKIGKRIFGFTYCHYTTSNNLIYWQTFLRNPGNMIYTSTIEQSKIPYFDAAIKFLYNIMRPHGENSMLDLTSKLQTIFSGLTKKIERHPPTVEMIDKIVDLFIIPGFEIFAKLEKLGNRFSDFLSLLPGSIIPLNRLLKVKQKISELSILISKINSGISIWQQLKLLLREISGYVCTIHEYLRSLEKHITSGEYQ